MNFNPTIAGAVFMQTVIDARNRTKSGYIAKQRQATAGANATPSEVERAAYDDAMRCFDKALLDAEVAVTFGVKALHAKANAEGPA